MANFFKSVPIQFLHTAKGCSEQDIFNLESVLQKKIAMSLREYLLIFGKYQTIFKEWDWHGCEGILKIQSLVDELITVWESQGIDMKLQKQIVPFFNFQDTIFYVPFDLSDDPAVYSLDIGDEPTVKKRNDHFSDFIEDWMQQTLLDKFW